MKQSTGIAGKTNRRLTRRRFLGAAAALAAPLVVPAGALGLSGDEPPSERVTLGFIGTGGRGTGNMQAFLPLASAQVVAVCDVKRDKREAAAKIVAQQYEAAGRGGGKPCDAYNDFRELLARDDVDAVVLSPQDHWHAPIAVAAARAGKDMYCEKPLGVAVTECAAIRDAVRRYERVFQTGTQQRSDAKFRHASNLARFGYLGKVHTVEVAAPGPRYQPRYEGPATPAPVPEGFDYEMYVGPARMRPFTPYAVDWPGWYLIWDYCAGFIVNWGVHHLDIAHWGCPSISERPCRVTCRSVYRTHPVCDNISSWQADFVFDDGLKMQFTDTGNPLPQGTRFIGDEGWVHVNRAGIEAEPASLLEVRIPPEKPSLYESSHHQADFIDCVLKRRDPVAPVEAGHVASYLGMIAETAGRLQCELRWDPAAEQFAGNSEANRLLTRPMRSPWRV
ncbi:MAG: Gfo/Idh/MocA family oxidoreductase [Planctomycetota bacterium]